LVASSASQGRRYPRVLGERLRAAPGGAVYWIVGHPAYDDEATRQPGNEGYPPSAAALNLNLEREAFIAAEMVHLLAEGSNQLVRYEEPAKA